MKIKGVIKKLKEIEKEHGNIECTCTASFVGDNDDVFETTVENFAVKEKGVGECPFKRVRLLL